MVLNAKSEASSVPSVVCYHCLAHCCLPCCLLFVKMDDELLAPRPTPGRLRVQWPPPPIPQSTIRQPAQDNQVHAPKKAPVPQQLGAQGNSPAPVQNPTSVPRQPEQHQTPMTPTSAPSAQDVSGQENGIDQLSARTTEKVQRIQRKSFDFTSQVK